MTLTFKNIPFIAVLRYNCDITTDNVTIEMIKITINILYTNSITLEEAIINIFT